MFIFSFKAIEATKSIFQHTATMWKFWKSRFSDFNLYEIKNKHHHSTQRGRLSYHDPIFRMIGGYLTDSRALGKIHLAPEQNKPARLGLVKVERGQFSLSNDHINLKIQCKMLSEYRRRLKFIIEVGGDSSKHYSSNLLLWRKKPLN